MFYLHCLSLSDSARSCAVYVLQLAFTQSELLTIYAMLCQASVFAGRDMLQVLVPLMGNGFWYATTENEWAHLFHQHLPDWLVVGKQEVLQGFYKGESTFYLSSNTHRGMAATNTDMGGVLPRHRGDNALPQRAFTQAVAGT